MTVGLPHRSTSWLAVWWPVVAVWALMIGLALFSFRSLIVSMWVTVADLSADPAVVVDIPADAGWSRIEAANGG